MWLQVSRFYTGGLRHSWTKTNNPPTILSRQPQFKWRHLRQATSLVHVISTRAA